MNSKKLIPHCCSLLTMIFFAVVSAAQTPHEDSIGKVLQAAKSDIERCRILYLLTESEEDQAIWARYNSQLKEITERNLRAGQAPQDSFLYYYSGTLNNEGYLQDQLGNIKAALQAFNKSLEIKKRIHDEEGIAVVYNNIAGMYQRQGQFSLAIELNLKALNIWKKLSNKAGLASSYHNLGTVYYEQGNLEKAIESISYGLKLREQLNITKDISSSLLSLGEIYESQNDTALALKFYHKALSLQMKNKDLFGQAQTRLSLGYHFYNKGSIEESIREFRESIRLLDLAGDKQGHATALNNLGFIYSNALNDRKTAMKLFEEALRIRQEINDLPGTANSYLCIGELLMKEKKLLEARAYTEKSMELNLKSGIPADIASSAMQLSRIFRQTGNYQKALENYELGIRMRDSINNESNRKAAIRSQLKYEYEKQAAADSVAHAKETEIKNAELKKQEAEIKVKKNQQYALFGGLALVMVFAAFMFNRFKVTQKQKTVIEVQKSEVEKQKKLVEEKQKEILDSIHYAKRIQLAQIPSNKRVNATLTRLRE